MSDKKTLPKKTFRQTDLETMARFWADAYADGPDLQLDDVFVSPGGKVMLALTKWPEGEGPGRLFADESRGVKDPGIPTALVEPPADAEP